MKDYSILRFLIKKSFEIKDKIFYLLFTKVSGKARYFSRLSSHLSNHAFKLRIVKFSNYTSEEIKYFIDMVPEFRNAYKSVGLLINNNITITSKLFEVNLRKWINNAANIKDKQELIEVYETIFSTRRIDIPAKENKTLKGIYALYWRGKIEK